MNVKELKEVIENLPDEMEVILQKDSEGNGFSPLDEANADYIYIANSYWSGDVYYIKWSAADVCKTADEWEELKSHNRILLLCPTD